MADISSVVGDNEPRIAPALRATDADRDRIIQVFNDSYSTGQITAEEHEVRTELALRATTLAELVQLTADLVRPAPSTKAHRMTGRATVLAAILIATALATGLGVALTRGPSVPATTATTAAPSDGFVRPQPALAGRICQALFAAQSSGSTGGINTEPSSNPWGSQPLDLPANPSLAFMQDLATAQSLENATLVVQQLWQKNGYQYSQLTIKCIAAYDSLFEWLAPGVPSARPTAISVAYADRHTLLAAKSASGACWYELNVMGPNDPVITRDGLGSYGSFFEKGGTRCSADSAPSFADWEQGHPLPPQLGP